MFFAPIFAWLIAQAPSFAISLVVSILQRTGEINALEANGIKVGSHVIKAVEAVKTYSEPNDFPKEVHANGV